MQKVKENKNSVPYSEICNSEKTNFHEDQEGFLDGDVEVLMGKDINLKGAKVEKVFKFSK